jgi:hypothetical protein
MKFEPQTWTLMTMMLWIKKKKFELDDTWYVLFLLLAVCYAESKTWMDKMDGFFQMDEPRGMH